MSEIKPMSPSCWRCAHLHGVETDGEFTCSACGKVYCRLCVEDHAREVHPMPYEAEIRSRLAVAESVRTVLALLVSVSGLAAIVTIGWPERARFLALALEPRIMMAAGTAIAVGLVHQFLLRRIADWFAGLVADRRRGAS